MATPTTTAPSEHESYGRALELMGQMPTLACRAAVNALMAASASASERGAINADFRADIDKLSTLLTALKEGDPACGVSPAAAALLEQRVWSDAQISEAVDGYVASAYFVSVQLAGPSSVDQAEVRRLGQMAASVVAQAFERATTIVRELFNERTAQDRRNVSDARDLTARTIDKLNDLTLHIQLISINASVEAARAGPAGAGFGVIAQEINMLSLGAQTAVKEISTGFDRLR